MCRAHVMLTSFKLSWIHWMFTFGSLALINQSKNSKLAWRIHYLYIKIISLKKQKEGLLNNTRNFFSTILKLTEYRKIKKNSGRCYCNVLTYYSSNSEDFEINSQIKLTKQMLTQFSYIFFISYWIIICLEKYIEYFVTHTKNN